MIEKDKYIPEPLTNKKTLNQKTIKRCFVFMNTLHSYLHNLLSSSMKQEEYSNKSRRKEKIAQLFDEIKLPKNKSIYLRWEKYISNRFLTEEEIINL